MSSRYGFEMEKFNGTNFDPWKLNMEDLLIDRYLWVGICGSKPTIIKDEEWVMLEKKMRILIDFVCPIQYYWMFLKKEM
jgi:hypothetical protein